MLFWLWLNLVRRWKSPLLYWIFRYTKYRGRELPDIWDDIKDLPIDEFHLKITRGSKYDYLSDPLGGLLDYSPQEKNFFFLDRETSRDCLPEFETVYVNGGNIKRLDEVSTGDKVLSYNFLKNELEYKEVLDKWEIGDKELYKIEFYNGKSSFSSLDHKFYGYKCGNHNDYSVMKLEDFKLEFDRCKKMNRRIVSKKRKTPVLKRLSYKEVDIDWLNEDLCFLLGYYLAEGWKKRFYFRMGGYDIPEYVLPLLEKQNINYNYYERKDNLSIIGISGHENDKFFSLIFKLKNKSDDMTGFNQLTKLPRNKLEKILEGIFLGDGHYENDYTKVYSTCSSELKDFISNVSYKIGRPIISYYRSDSQGAGENPLPIWRIHDNEKSYFKRDYGYNDLSETSILNIEDTGKKSRMVDIEVKDNHNFFLASSGVLVHNCDNWSRMWYWYHRYHGREAKEIGMKNLETGKAHAVTVAKFSDGWELYDYRPTQLREDTIRDALENNLVNYEVFIWTGLKG